MKNVKPILLKHNPRASFSLKIEQYGNHVRNVIYNRVEDEVWTVVDVQVYCHIVGELNQRKYRLEP